MEQAHDEAQIARTTLVIDVAALKEKFQSFLRDLDRIEKGLENITTRMNGGPMGMGSQITILNKDVLDLKNTARSVKRWLAGIAATLLVVTMVSFVTNYIRLTTNDTIRDMQYNKLQEELNKLKEKTTFKPIFPRE